MDCGKYLKGFLLVAAVVSAMWAVFTIVATKEYVASAMQPVVEQVQQVSSNFIYWRTEERIKELEGRLTEYEYEYKDREMPDVVKKEYESRVVERDKLLEKMGTLEKPEEAENAE